MANLASIKNTDTQSVDTLANIGGTTGIKRGLGDKTPGGGLTPHLQDQAVGTHLDGDTFAATDSVVTIAGVNPSGVVEKASVDAAGKLQVAVAPAAGLLTDQSGALTTGGTAEVMMASNADRAYLLIQNIDTAEDLWFNFTTTAVADQPSIKLGPGDSFVMESGFISTQAISVIAATTGHKWTAKEG